MAPARPATHGSSEADRPDPRPLRWFWPVDPTFGAWLARRLKRVEAERIPIPDRELYNARIVRNYLNELCPGSWAECERIATAGPVHLPDALLTETLYAVRCGDVPAWDGWERAWDRHLVELFANSLPASAPDDLPDPPPRPVAPTRTRRSRSRPGATADLF